MSEAANHGNPGRELISFRIGAQEFCVDIARIHKMFTGQELLPIKLGMNGRGHRIIRNWS